ncbi:MAG: hypothetical protein ACFFD9_06585 [Candidatus Thorarchaeota archaeon]
MSEKLGLRGDGIVVKADLKLLREATTRVIHDYSEEWYGRDGASIPEKAEVSEGEQIVFRERIDVCPAIVVASKLGDELWYVVTSAECPDVRCDDHQAMKCARLVGQNLRIFQDAISRKAEWEWVHEWRIDATDHPRVQGIVDRATKKWTID